MTKIFLLALIGLGFLTSDLLAFKQIVVQNGETAAIYEVSQLQTAINQAQAGSDIYLPGGHHFAGTYNITKKLNIYGAGAFNKSTSATGISSVERFLFKTGSDSSLIEGISSHILCGHSAEINSNITINKCKVTQLQIGVYQNTTNIIFKDCVISGHPDNHIGSKNNSTYFYNCIFDRTWSYQNRVSYEGYNINFYNCIFHSICCNTNMELFTVNSSANNYFENCIFKTDNGKLINTGRLNVFKNCLITANQTDWGTENIAEDCLINQHKDSIFVNIVGTDNYYSEDNDYHLKETCEGKNYGTDGTDLGIYGTAVPFKENSIPIIPHIQAFAPATKTVDGKLEISVDVESQTK